MKLKWLTTVLTAGAVAALAAGGGAKAYVDTIYKYSAPKNGFLVLPAAAFVPPSNTSTWSNNGTQFSAANGCFVAPVNLPNGSNITALSYWYKKSSTVVMSVEFSRRKLADDSAAQIVNDFPDATAGARKGKIVQVSNTSLQAVDNARYQYILTVCLHDSVDKFQTARITYTYTTAGD